MKYLQQIYESLSRGAFLSANTTREDAQNWYKDVIDNLEDYKCFFAKIGYRLEEGTGYLYFSRKEARQNLTDKLSRFGEWIDRLAFLKSYEPTLCAGMELTKSKVLVKIDSDIELKDCVRKLGSSTKSDEEIVGDLFDSMVRIGFLELVNEQSGKCKITSAYNYLEDIVNLITVPDDGEQEIS